MDVSDVREKMLSLAQTHFIQRAVTPVLSVPKPQAETPNKKGSNAQPANTEPPVDPERFVLPANGTTGKSESDFLCT